MHPLCAIHTVGSLRHSAGGPPRTVTALCAGLGRLGVAVELFSQDNPPAAPGDANATPPAELVRTTLAETVRLPLLGSGYAPGLGKALRERCQAAAGGCVFHDHGLWLPINHQAAAAARRLSAPLVVSPRGMLEPWSLNHRAWKKRLAWWLYQRQDLQAARVLHATAEQEAENFRRLGLRQPVAVVPNGVDIPAGEDSPGPAGPPRTVLFLSRVHPKKGLLELVEAWRLVRPEGWRAVIAGPDEGGHRAEVEAAIRRAGLEACFEWVGAVDGGAKTARYRQAELFVLPSFSENFGVAVAEALACGTPAITTRGAPWAGLLEHGCGWWVEVGAAPLAAALREATAMPPDSLRAMGLRGRDYARQAFAWPGIARQMLEVYQWMLGLGAKPDCVRLD